MKNFRRGTPEFGILLGVLFVAAAALLMWIGFWRTLLLAVLFAAGYFIGAVNNKSDFVRETVDKVVPQKKDQTIDFRAEVQKEQENLVSRMENEAEEDAPADETAEEA